MKKKLFYFALGALMCKLVCMDKKDPIEKKLERLKQNTKDCLNKVKAIF